ncbi:MAG: 6,7-dimethyl-8-ribityllumazine synthase [Chthoniobacter sp.]|jgi:6,7-dimethyl-8-ribityllumazine synthase|nr:6,7-dimethyl-8-ribityllumazine synthase [Chthoniobacter sp.]
MGGQKRCTFAIVASQYNAEFVHGLTDNARRELQAISNNFQIKLIEVPGAFEIPLAVQELAGKNTIDAIIALGVIIEGATAHASLIGAAVTRSLQQISLQHRVPVIHEVLLVKDEAQARERCLGTELNRGQEAARAAARMVEVMSELRNER